MLAIIIYFNVDDTDIAKIERRAEIAEKNVEELEDTRMKLDARVSQLQRQLIEKEQKIESLTSQIKTLEIQARNVGHSGREVPPKPTPRVCMYVYLLSLLHIES